MFYFDPAYARGQDSFFQDDRHSDARSAQAAARLENAARARKNCVVFAKTIFTDARDYEQAFGKTVSRFFGEHLDWHVCLECPEIHIHFLAVDVFPQYPIRGVDGVGKKQALLDGLRSGYASFAQKIGMDVGGLLNILVMDACLVEGTLILELPYSIFPAQYPDLCQTLETGVYKAFREGLDMLAEIW